MNSTVSALVDQQPSTIGPTSSDINPLIQSYDTRYMVPYLSGAYIVEALPTLGPWGTPYWMQGIPLQTCNMNAITAPHPQQRSSMTHIVRGTQQAGQVAFGQAPTKGIYTGVEGSC